MEAGGTGASPGGLRRRDPAATGPAPPEPLGRPQPRPAGRPAAAAAQVEHDTGVWGLLALVAVLVLFTSFVVVKHADHHAARSLAGDGHAAAPLLLPSYPHAAQAGGGLAGAVAPVLHVLLNAFHYHVARCVRW